MPKDRVFLEREIIDWLKSQYAPTIRENFGFEPSTSQLLELAVYKLRSVELAQNLLVGVYRKRDKTFLKIELDDGFKKVKT